MGKRARMWRGLVSLRLRGCTRLRRPACKQGACECWVPRGIPVTLRLPRPLDGRSTGRLYWGEIDRSADCIQTMSRDPDDLILPLPIDTLTTFLQSSISQPSNSLLISTAQVFWVALFTALATGLGALPVLFLKNSEPRWRGIAAATASGMMLSASVFALADEALGRGGAAEVVGGHARRRAVLLVDVADYRRARMDDPGAESNKARDRPCCCC